MAARVRVSFPLSDASDCDIHTAVPDTQDLTPYLDEYGREMCVSRDLADTCRVTADDDYVAAQT